MRFLHRPNCDIPEPLALQAFQHRLVRDAFFPIEKLEGFLDRRLESAFGPIPHFAPILLAERAVGDASRDLLNLSHIRIPTDEIDEERNDRCMFAYRFSSILPGQGAFKVTGTLLQLVAHGLLVGFKLFEGLEISLHLIPRNRDLPSKNLCHRLDLL